MSKVLIFLTILLYCNLLQARNERDTLGTGRRILFSENKGQWEKQVLYRSMMGGITLFAERDCFTFVVQHPENDNLNHRKSERSLKRRYRQHSYRMHFVGSNCGTVTGDEKELCHENYFIGNDRSRWATNVGVYGSLIYKDLYDGIDMKVYTASNAMKYDFIVHPGANPDKIAMSYDGVDGVKLQGGNIVIRTSVVDVVELRPYAYQVVDGKQVEVDAEFVLNGKCDTPRPLHDLFSASLSKHSLDVSSPSPRGEATENGERYTITFKLGEYDTTRALIIDPYLHFSTYTGSTADNWGTTGCFDSEKNTYTSGLVFGPHYPVSLGAYDSTFNGYCDIGIFKFDTNGSHRLYATYLGGQFADMPHSMYVNNFDELVIFGTTGSPNFPVTPNAYDMTFNGGTSLQYEGSPDINFPNGSDIFVCRLSSDGSELQASTYIGGSGNDGLNYRASFDYSTISIGNDSLYFNYGDGARGEIITDDMNNIYVGSTTYSVNFPVTEGCIQPYSRGRQEGVVFKIDYNLSHLIWSTYLGGNRDDAIYSIDCDKDYNIVVCGGTNSMNLNTTPDAYRRYYRGGSADGFIAKISYYGKTLMAQTYFGSSAYDQCYFVRCGKTDDIFIFGQTKATGSTLIYNANYNVPNSGQMLARFSPLLDSLRWSTVFGTGDVNANGPNISPTAFAVDICNRIYLSGWGRIFLGLTFNGVNYPWGTHGTTGMTVTPDAYQSTTDGQDFYIMALDIDANNLVYATFFGEQHDSESGYRNGQDHVDGGTSRFDRLGTIYQSVCASCGGSDNFPVTTDAYSQHNNCSSNCNNAIFRLSLTNDFPVAEFNYTRSSGCNPTIITFHNTGRGASYLWDFGDGTTSTAVNPTHSYPDAGFYTVRLVAYMPNGCRTSDTIEKTITILGGTNVPPLDTLSTCPGTPIQIGVHPEPGLTYHWVQGLVSDSNIANPMAEQPGVYQLWITTGDNSPCGKLLEQVIIGGEIDARIIGDSVTCSIPTILDLTARGANDNPVFQWSTNRDFSDTLNSNMDTGLYSFVPVDGQWLYGYVYDALGCFGTDSFQVHFYRVVDSLRLNDPRCPRSCDGSACVVPLQGSALAPYQYNWGDGWGNIDSMGWLCEADYTVLFRDANGCLVTNNFTLTDPAAPTITADIVHIRCLESCTGIINVSVTGYSTYNLLWLDDSSTSANRTNLCPGQYILQVSDSNGCLYYDTLEVLENVDMNVDITLSGNTCPDKCSGKATAVVEGGYEPYSYIWTSGEESQVAEALCDGKAVVVVTDAYGCQVSDSIVVGIQHSFDSIEVWADDPFVFSGHSTGLHVTEIPGGSYWWMPSNLLNNPSSANPIATLEDSTTFVVTLTDSIGCTYIDSIKINCISVSCGKPNIFIPNAFTPNEDGINDQLCFRGEWVSEFHIAIFTRWGEKVYESEDITQCWDGRYKNNWCMPGVYVYHCRIQCADGQKAQFKGDVTLIR
ncbi:MAG: gliding motility-associated C-terminal domain-containing protein [Bacteroidales bacterium]|nr:gliding motility-associated C-terminal domain-containing protein [Bacteroidales bacterium]